MKPWEHFAAQPPAQTTPPTRKIPKRPLEGAERKKHEDAAARAGAESERYRREGEEASSPLGIAKGMITQIGRDIHDSNYGLDYLKDWGGGIATALEEADQGPVTPGDAILGAGAPIISYPFAMASGAVAAPFSGDYGGVRDQAFENVNDTLPEGAKRVQGVLGAVFKPVGDLLHTAGRGMGEIAGSLGAPEQLQENIADVSEDVFGFAGVKAKAPRGTPGLKPGPAPRKPVTPGPTADPVARARDAGYTLPASARTAEGKKAAPIGSMAEGVSGRSQNQHRVDQLNDQRVLKGIRKDLGLPENSALTKPAISAIMDETGKVYDAVRLSIPSLKVTPALTEAISGIGAKRKNNPYLKETPSVAKLRTRLANAGNADTGQVLDAIQEFRDDARLISQNAEKPEQIQRAKASREAADVLENALDEAISAAGRPDLIPSLKNARVRRAKAHQALEAVSGKKRPGVALMDMKQGGELLTGEMDLAADVMRDMGPNGPLSVDTASGAANAPGLIQETLQGVTRPLIQPILNSEFGQRRMFGPRQPETLSPYDPKQFDIPSVVEQGELLGPGLDLAPVAGRAGGAMPSATRRLNTTVAGQQDAIGSLLDLEGEGAVGGPLPSRLRDPEQAPSMFSESLPIDLDGGPGGPPTRRRNPEADLGENERRRRIIEQRQAVLDRPIGTKDQGLAGQYLADPANRALVEGDTRRLRGDILEEGATGDPLEVTADLPMGEAIGGGAAAELPPNVTRLSDARARRDAAASESIGDMIPPDEMFGGTTMGKALEDLTPRQMLEEVEASFIEQGGSPPQALVDAMDAYREAIDAQNESFARGGRGEVDIDAAEAAFLDALERHARGEL